MEKGFFFSFTEVKTCWWSSCRSCSESHKYFTFITLFFQIQWALAVIWFILKLVVSNGLTNGVKIPQWGVLLRWTDLLSSFLSCRYAKGITSVQECSKHGFIWSMEFTLCLFISPLWSLFKGLRLPWIKRTPSVRHYQTSDVVRVWPGLTSTFVLCRAWKQW